MLVQPQIPENIGAVARAMENMGISRLALINPENYEFARAKKMATGSSLELLRRAEIYEDLEEALKPYQYVVGATARTGSSRPTMNRPRDLARDLIPLSQNNLISILFGPEDRGLSNRQLRYCQSLITIPTARFPSLNLGHAAMIICYELYSASRKTVPETPPRLANTFELEGMYAHLKDVFTKIGFIDPQNPEHWMLNIRRFLSRVPLRARETRIIRGVCRQLDWYTGQLEKKRRRD